MEIQRSLKPLPAAPSHGYGHMAAEMGLSIGAGIVADRMAKSLMQRGTATSVVAGLAAAAAVKVVGEMGIGAVDNARAGRSITIGLGDRALTGLRTGLIDGGLALAAPRLQKGLARKMPDMGIVGQSAFTGLVLGTAGGALTTGTSTETWKHGAVAGLKQVGVATAMGGAGGFVLGGATGAVLRRFHPAFKPKTDTATPAPNANSTVPAEAFGPQKPGTPPSEEIFRKVIPHHPGQPGKAQTLLKYGDREFQVMGYDAKKGIVTLRHESSIEAATFKPVRLKGFQGLHDPKAIKAGALVQTDVPVGGKPEIWTVTARKGNQVTLSRSLPTGEAQTQTVKTSSTWFTKRLQGANAVKAGDLKPGTTFVDNAGKAHEVVTWDSHGSGKAIVKRVKTLEMPIGTFTEAAEGNLRLTASGIGHTPPAPTKASLVKQFFGIGEHRLIPMTGTKQVTIVSQSRQGVVYDLALPQVKAGKVLSVDRLPAGTVIEMPNGSGTDRFTVALENGKKVLRQELDILRIGQPKVGETFQVGNDTYRVARLTEGRTILDKAVPADKLALKNLPLNEGPTRISVQRPGRTPDVFEMRTHGETRMLLTRKPIDSTVYRFKVGEGMHAREVEVAVENLPFGIRDRARLADARRMLSQTPPEYADVQGLIRFNRRAYYLDRLKRMSGEENVLSGSAAATAAPKGTTSTGQNVPVTDFYPTGTRWSTKGGTLRTYWHESGHQIARRHWNNTMPPQEWAQLRNADATNPSAYGQTNLAEDFAETVMDYIATDAGRLNPGTRSTMLNRFRGLDRLFGLDSQLVEQQVALTTKLQKIRLATVGAVGVGAAGTGGLVYWQRHQTGGQTATSATLPSEPATTKP